jgi:hypothetical protein
MHLSKEQQPIFFCMAQPDNTEVSACACAHARSAAMTAHADTSPASVAELVQDLMHQATLAYKGYVSDCAWDQNKPTAQLLFMLAEEALAAGLCIMSINREVKSISWSAPHPLEKLDSAQALILRIGITSNRCDVMQPDDRTGRLVRRVFQHFTTF